MIQLPYMAPERPQREQAAAFSATLRERFNAGLLSELAPFPQWVLWKQQVVDGKMKKVPFSPSGYQASVKRPDTWGSVSDTLTAFARGGYSGIGFMLTEQDPFCLVDIDHTYSPEEKRVTSPLAARVISTLASYTERSPNDGIHILVQAPHGLPGPGLHTALEMYDRGRFTTITTHHIRGTPLIVAESQQDIEALYQEFQVAPPVRPSRRESTRGGVVGEGGGQPGRPDSEVMHLAMSAKNGEAFLALWEGRWQENPRYVSQGQPDTSKADWQLVRYLLYWTGNDVVQTDRLFRQSALMREKWDERVNSGGGGHSYGEVTIYNAMK